MNKVFLMIMLFCSTAMGVKSLSQDTLANWLKTSPPFDFVLIDVRSASEVAGSGMIGNAQCKPYNIPWPDAFKQAAPSLLKQQQIVIYCQSGNRAGQAARYLDSLGYENVYNAGGWGTWGPARDASLKLTIADTMAVSKLPAISMKASVTATQFRASGVKAGSVPHTSTVVMSNRSMNPVKSGRYYSTDGRIIPMVSDQKRKVSLVVVSKRQE
jgi:rhodanese-related sulfurtransferase